MIFLKRCVAFTVFIVLFFRSNVTAIFDANEAVAGIFRYHVAITAWRNTTTSLDKWYCSGAILSSKAVVTSYKCVLGSNFNGSWSGTWFRIQTDCLSYMNQTCPFYMSKISPRTTPEKRLAIIKLDPAEEIIFDDRVKAVTLPPHNNRTSSFFNVPDASLIFATGYLTNNTTPIQRKADVLRYLIMKIVRFSVCFRQLPENTFINHTTIFSSICAQGIDIVGESPKGSLCTELGAPLAYLTNGKLIGILDSTDSNCTIGGPTLFIKIESFVNWINEHISCPLC